MRWMSLCVAVFASASTVASAQAPARGEFRGELDWLPFRESCPSWQREGRLPPISGVIQGQTLALRLPRGQNVRVPIAPDGSFTAEAVLRPDPLGTKMQYYRGRIADNQVTIDAEHVTPGQRNRCIARAVLPIHRVPRQRP
jgi:hypothetical protein